MVDRNMLIILNANSPALLHIVKATTNSGEEAIEINIG